MYPSLFVLIGLTYSLQSVLNGYNGTIMAYGQTGTGKTYTLGRMGKEDASERGIMVRALEDIIANVSPTSDSVEISYLQVLCTCSFMSTDCHTTFTNVSDCLFFLVLDFEH